MKIRKLDRGFYCRPALKVARDLLGKLVVKGDMIGRIVETEAYLGIHDKASHASSKRKETCFPMWGIGGFSYVYLTYGIHYMFNVSTGEEGDPSAVLIRAVEPVKNIQGSTNGPGRLTRTLSIGKEHNNKDLTTSEDLYIAEDSVNPRKFKVIKAKRIGVDYAGIYAQKLWRFYIYGNKYVSRIIR